MRAVMDQTAAGLYHGPHAAAADYADVEAYSMSMEPGGHIRTHIGSPG